MQRSGGPPVFGSLLTTAINSGGGVEQGIDQQQPALDVIEWMHGNEAARNYANYVMNATNVVNYVNIWRENYGVHVSMYLII